jgi:hypothetical protein
MSRSVTVSDVGLLWLVLLISLTGCSTVCHRCLPDEQPPARGVSNMPSRAEQEIWAQRTWTAFIEHRALHEARATQVAAIDAEYDRLVHLPRVSLQVRTPIPLATALRLLVAETGYSVVYGVGVEAQRAVTPAFVHQRLDAASDALVRPLGYHAQLNTRDRQIEITALMTGRWRLPAFEQTEERWQDIQTTLTQSVASSTPTDAPSGNAVRVDDAPGTVLIDRATRTIAVSAPIPQMAVIEAYLSGLGAERLDTREE